jgi:hypothetical protein
MTETESGARKRAEITRRRLLTGAGALGAGVAAATSAGVLPGTRLPAARAAAASKLPPGAPANSMLFGRIFPKLDPFAQDTSTVTQALLEVGKQGGIMDAGDDLAAGPVALITNPALNGNPTSSNPYGTNPDN